MDVWKLLRPYIYRNCRDPGNNLCGNGDATCAKRNVRYVYCVMYVVHARVSPTRIVSQPTSCERLQRSRLGAYFLSFVTGNGAGPFDDDSRRRHHPLLLFTPFCFYRRSRNKARTTGRLALARANRLTVYFSAGVRCFGAFDVNVGAFIMHGQTCVSWEEIKRGERAKESAPTARKARSILRDTAWLRYSVTLRRHS